MLKVLFWVGVLALWSSSFQQGCQDVRKAVTHLTYSPTRDMRQTIAILPQRTTWGAPDSLSVPTIGRDAPDLLPHPRHAADHRARPPAQHVGRTGFAQRADDRGGPVCE